MAVRHRKEASEEKEKAPIRYVHIDEFLAKKPDLPPYDKQGFRIFMKGRTYMHSFEDFEKALKEFYNRKR